MENKASGNASPPPSPGLTKSFGLSDVFIYNVGLISIGMAIAFLQRYGPGNYRDCSLILATLLATALMVAVSLGFWAWTSVLPRSGGLYIFLTRSRFPALGFALSFIETVGWLFYAAVTTTLLSTMAVSPFAAACFGIESRPVQFLNSTVGKLSISSAAIWLAAAVLISGTRSFLRWQRILFALAMIGTIALFVALAQNPAVFHRNFNTAFNFFGPDPYQVVIAHANATDWPHSTLRRTLSLVNWPFLSLIGAVFSIGIAGEVRHHSKNQFLGMLGSLAFCGIALVIALVLANHSIGTPFLGAMMHNFDNRPPDGVNFCTPFEPYFTYFACLATDSLMLRTLICLGFVCWIWFWILGVFAYVQRTLFAWGADGAAPASLAQLCPKTSTPYVAALACAAAAQLILLLTHFNFIASLIFILAIIVPWLAALALGVIFPFVSPAIFQASPIKDKRLLGIPLMSIFCFAGAAALAVMFILLWRDKVAAGHDRNSLAVIGLMFFSAFIFHLIFRPKQKRQGVDIALAQTEPVQ